MFRIGHLGFFNDLMLCGTLCGVEMGLALRDVPHRKDGVAEALAYLQPRPHERSGEHAGRSNGARHDGRRTSSEAGRELPTPHPWRRIRQ